MIFVKVITNYGWQRAIMLYWRTNLIMYVYSTSILIYYPLTHLQYDTRKSFGFTDNSGFLRHLATAMHALRQHHSWRWRLAKKHVRKIERSSTVLQPISHHLYNIFHQKISTKTDNCISLSRIWPHSKLVMTSQAII